MCQITSSASLISETVTAMDELDAVKAKIDALERKVAKYEAQLNDASTTEDRKIRLENLIISTNAKLTALCNEKNILLQQNASGKNYISMCILMNCAVWLCTLNSVVNFAECSN